MVYQPRQPLPYHTKRHYHYFTKNLDPTLGDPTPQVKPLGEPKPVEMSIPKLPNDLIMGIIKLADGGKTAHESKMKLVLESIKQTGGWYGWHRERDTLDGEWCPAIYGLVEPEYEYHFSGREDYAGIQWGDVLKSTPYWIDELFDAEYDNHSEIVVGRDISADELRALITQ